MDQLDERSDVFALGAILCEILTGKPPYVEETGDLLSMAATCQLDAAHARLADSGADAELVALAKRCMMPARSARPSSAEAVAQSIHGYLASAEQRTHEANVRTAALERTHKLGVALLLAIATGLAVSLWFWRSADRAQADEKAARGKAEANLANFNRLSLFVHLETAIAREKELRPAHPRLAPQMRHWLDHDARRLRDALESARATLAVLEERALPRSEADKARARNKHPRGAELERLGARLAALRRSHAVRSGALKPAPFVLNEAKVPKTVFRTYTLAALLVHGLRREFGREAEGLALARRAVELANDAERAAALLRLAWALSENGFDAEARLRMDEAVAAVAPNKRKAYEGFRDNLEKSIELAASGSVLEKTAQEHETLKAEIDRSQLELANSAEKFLYSTLNELVRRIETFLQTEVRDVERRLSWALRVEELTVTRYRDRWDQARRAIRNADGVTASELYAAVPIDLEPQIGLIPIGMNPKTKLWEFYHLRSAWGGGPDDPVELGLPKTVTERIRMDRRGIVFVLIPGGKFFMGSQGRDETAPNYDPASSVSEQPVDEVELAPYFLSRYELTQGQWARLTAGRYPSWYKMRGQYNGIRGLIRDSHPVESVTWAMCDALLREHGLTLPTESQWEYACRAGTTTPWFTGESSSSLANFANVLDRTARRVPPLWSGSHERFDDGFKGPAPVGTYGANAFGLFDTHGNVGEWCQDWFVSSYKGVARPGDGLRDPLLGEKRVFRGGSHTEIGVLTRAAVRSRLPPSSKGSNIGVRPARSIDR